jgi:hypothetical protein
LPRRELQKAETSDAKTQIGPRPLTNSERVMRSRAKKRLAERRERVASMLDLDLDDEDDLAEIDRLIEGGEGDDPLTGSPPTEEDLRAAVPSFDDIKRSMG